MLVFGLLAVLVQTGRLTAGQATDTLVKENTINYHVRRREAITMDNGSVSVNESALPRLANSPAAFEIALSPAPSSAKGNKPAVAPSSYNLFGDGSLFGAGDGTWAYGNSKYTIPVTIIVCLIFVALIGVFIVYWRRKRAANYYGLKEAELNSVQMHRS